MVDKIERMTVKELARVCKKTVKSLHKRVLCASKKSCLLDCGKFGLFVITKPGKSYQLIRMQTGYTEKEIDKKFVELLRLLQKSTCDNCRDIIDGVINAEQV